MTQRHASDSGEQRDAEVIALMAVNTTLALALQPEKLVLSNGECINVDGVDRTNQALCEIYCRIGALKPAQVHKVSSDILKLCLAERELGSSWRKIVAFVDIAAYRTLAGRTWRAAAARQLGVELLKVDIPSETRASILAAQARQVMINPPRATDT
jgi:hypothetical protein